MQEPQKPQYASSPPAGRNVNHFATAAVGLNPTVTLNTSFGSTFPEMSIKLGPFNVPLPNVSNSRSSFSMGIRIPISK
jgi:hypothetical protein